MRFGYGRFSAKQHDYEQQINKFRERGIDDRFIFLDQRSGRNMECPEYQTMRSLIQEGDLLFLDELDRLGRDYECILREWKYLTIEVGADIVCLDHETLFDSRNFKSGNHGKLLEAQFLNLLEYIADQEREKRWQRQSKGIKDARAKGITFGRPRKEIDNRFLEVYQQWKDGHITATEAMRQIDMKRTTFYRRVKEIEQSVD